MRRIKNLLPQSFKNLYHLAQAILVNVWYGFPSRRLKVIGVTGTDGKTTTVQMITKILEEAGKKVAMASTINFVINGVQEKNLSHFTTESSFAVQKFIKKAVEAGCEYLVLETSSHALDQHRVWGVQYQTAVITNVTREHLDYHKTMEKYRAAKGELFKNLKSNLQFPIFNFQSISNSKMSKKIAIVNLDMEDPEYFLSFDADEKFGYTSKSTQSSENLKTIKAENIEVGISGSSYQIQNTRCQIQLPGLFNVENALAATCVGLSEGIDLETIKEALKKIRGVAGRMESVGNALGLHILIDFALTPNALERLYSTLFQTKKPDSKIIAVFGSCGDRDQGKRPIMGEVVSRYANYIILTNDEPYHENPAQIIDEIAIGIKNKKENETFWKIPDRREAIRKALKIAKPDDIIAVTGMGNFETMVVGDKKINWNDRQVIEEELVKI